MAVIDAALIQRWTQEPPATTSGEAFLPINADDIAADVVVTGTATIALQTGFPVAIPVSGDADIAADTVIAIRPIVAADAEAAITSTASSFDAHITAAIALADITATGSLHVAIDATAAVGLLGFVTPLPALTGSATVALVDNGQGSPPLFPFTFPTNFTDNPLGIQTADATITIEGTTDNVAAGGYADAIIRIVDKGNSFPFTFPVLFEGITGSTPIFAFVFPAVFTTEANGRLASAELDITGDAIAIPDVAGEATAAITATAIRVDPTRFPFALPAHFIS